MHAASGIRQEPAGTELTRTLILLAAWFFFAVWLGVTGRLAAGGGAPPIALGATIVVPLLLFAVDGRFGNPIFGGFLRLGLPALIALQTFRIIGITFVIAWLGGTLPAGFALPAGLGDVAVGLSAPLVAAAVVRRRRHHAVLARWWSVAAVADLVIAVTSGVMHSSTPLGVLAGPVSTDVMARYPLSLIPSFLVPLALLLHLCTFRALSAKSSDRADWTRPFRNRDRTGPHALRVGGGVRHPAGREHGARRRTGRPRHLWLESRGAPEAPRPEPKPPIEFKSVKVWAQTASASSSRSAETSSVGAARHRRTGSTPTQRAAQFVVGDTVQVLTRRPRRVDGRGCPGPAAPVAADARACAQRREQARDATDRRSCCS